MPTLNPSQFPAQEPEYETHYHLTDRAKFKPNAKQVPTDNTFAIESRTNPGLYTGDPEAWINGHGYARPFVAELRVPKGAAQKGRWGGESFIPGDRLKDVQVSRVIPTDAYAREKYGSAGWFEDHADTRFDTGEPIKRGAWGIADQSQFKDYHYDGPDARQMDPVTIRAHRKRANDFRKSR